MNSIFAYDDFRSYIRDYYAERKARGAGFSWREFAKLAGYSSPVFLKLVAEGKSGLGDLGVERVAVAMGLTGVEIRYFRALVAFGQASGDVERHLHLEEMRAIAKSCSAQVVQSDQYDFYSDWFHGALRELASVYDFQDDFRKLGDILTPAVSSTQVRKSLDLLLRLGLLEKAADGRYVQTSKHITTGSHVTSLAVRNLHRQMAGLAVNALDDVAKEERDISGMTLGLSEAGFATLSMELAAFRRRIVEIASADGDVERIYRINLQLFPLSKRIPSEGDA